MRTDNKSFDGKKDTNLIKVPDELAEQVIMEGSMDYRPRLGDKKNVIKTRQTNKSLGSFFKSGKSLNKAMSDCYRIPNRLAGTAVKQRNKF